MKQLSRCDSCKHYWENYLSKREYEKLINEALEKYGLTEPPEDNTFIDDFCKAYPKGIPDKIVDIMLEAAINEKLTPKTCNNGYGFEPVEDE